MLEAGNEHRDSFVEIEQRGSQGVSAHGRDEIGVWTELDDRSSLPCVHAALSMLFLPSLEVIFL